MTINARCPSELTIRGTIAVHVAGYLPGDRVLVRINGADEPATVVGVSCFRVEVRPDADMIARHFEVLFE